MNLKYRPDIDGLRCIAVLSVILFHLNNNWLQGGFIGVDIFFVISGFLITKIIYSEIKKNQFSFKTFYQRRINRILPVFFMVMFCTAFTAWNLLPPDELMTFVSSLLKTIYFWENMFFAQNTGGYWDFSAEQMPILHTWSLAVEEQFYIIFPFLLLFLTKLQFKKTKFNTIFIISILAFIAFISFCLAQYSPLSLFLTEYNYYSLFTGRAGELLIGSIFAIISVYKSEIDIHNSQQSLFLYNTLTIMSFIGILVSLFFISEKNLFPSFLALIPTLSIGLILYCYHPNTLIARLLSISPLVLIGKLSYSLYLWHWPIIVLSRKYLLIEQFTNIEQYLFVGVATFILSILTYYSIETPCRKIKRSFKFSFIVYYLIPSLLIFGIYKVYKPQYNQIRQTQNFIKGKHDFLFLGNNYEHTIDKLTLSIKPTEKQKKALNNLFTNLTDVAKSTSTAVALMIGSDKSRIYFEYLPDGLSPSKDRYLDFYLKSLSKNKDLIIYDSKNDLISAKNNNEFLYYRTDTHWNQKGAFVAYKNFLKLLHLPIPDVSFKLESSVYGDLVSMGKFNTFPLHNDDNFSVIVDQSSMRCEILKVSKGAFGNSEKCFNDNALVDKYVWVIGDSFSVALRVYLQATFKEVDFLGHWDEKLPVIADDLNNAEVKPDILIIIRVERSF